MREKFLNAVEGALGVWLTVTFVPLVRSTWPAMPDWLPDIATPFVIFLAIGFISLLLWQRPVIDVAWKEDASPPWLQDLNVQLSPALSSAPFQVTFSGRPKGFLTVALLWWLRRRKLRMCISFVGAPIATTVMYSSSAADGGFLVASDWDNGISARVESPPQPDTWIWAKVVFQAPTSINAVHFTVRYEATASSGWSRLWSRLVHVRTDTNKMTIY